jgi:TolB protein
MRWFVSPFLLSLSMCLFTLITILSLARRESVEGAWLLFISGRDGSDEIYRMWQDGTHLRQLTDDPTGRKMHIAASPDGEWIAFVSDQQDAVSQIYLANPVGRDVRRLTFHDEPDFQPAWSPDGDSLLFLSDRNDGAGLFELSLAESPTSNPTLRLRGYVWNAEWSPDGRWATIMRRPKNNFDIYLVSLEGDALISLTTSPAYDGFATWSPDGEWIAFTSDRETGHYHIYRMRLTADCFLLNGCDTFSPPQRLTPIDFDGGFFDPQWSPDGEWIAFWGKHHNGKYQIYRMRADGSQMQALTPVGEDLAPAWQRLVEYPWHPLGWSGVAVIGVGLGMVCYWRWIALG